MRRFQWARCLSRGSAAARLLGLRPRIPPVARISVFCECVCCQVEVCATGLSPVHVSPAERGVSGVVVNPWPTRDYCVIEHVYGIG
jgi:hypothetical protein